MNNADHERFWSKVEKTEDCWNWITRRDWKGYGEFQVGGRTGKGYRGRFAKAHRVSFELANGPIPEGMQVDHICQNKGCVRPSHLRLVTNKQNQEHLRGAQRNSKSGVLGVSWRRGRNPGEGKWCATVGHNGKKLHVGVYETIAEAESAVIAKRLELFTHNENDRAA